MSASRRRALAACVLGLLAGHAIAASAAPVAALPRLIVESCDLWSKPGMWDAVRRERPDWEPTLGFYSSDDPAIADAHARMAVAHGIAGFQSCWYRARGNAGHPVVPLFDGFIRALAGGVARRDGVVWDIFWDNTNPVGDGASGPADFLDHVAAFWLDTYLTTPGYLRIDGRPVVAIASAGAFVRDMGGVAAARATLDAFRRAATARGLPGLTLLAADNADPRHDETEACDAGFDAIMQYATPVFTGLLRSAAPDPAAVAAAERLSWSLRIAHSSLPVLITASIGYDARLWSRSPLHYRLGPDDWRDLVRDALLTATTLPRGSPGRDIVLLDALNEFGEGHFIEPTRAFGDESLVAVAAGAAEARAALARTGADAQPASDAASASAAARKRSSRRSSSSGM